MRDEFLDECKDLIFTNVCDLEGNVYEDNYSLIDAIDTMIDDRIIYYNYTQEAIEKYSEEMFDGWEKVGYIFMQDQEFNPFNEMYQHAMCKKIMQTACRSIASDVIPSFDERLTLDKKLLKGIAKNLDTYEQYPFSERGYVNGYPYELDDNRFYQNRLDELFKKLEKRQKTNSSKKGVKL